MPGQLMTNLTILRPPEDESAEPAEHHPAQELERAETADNTTPTSMTTPSQGKKKRGCRPVTPTPRKAALKAKLKTAQRNANRLKRMLQMHTSKVRNRIERLKIGLKKHVGKGYAFSIISAHIDNVHRRPKGRRYTKELKALCLSLLYYSKKAYNVYRKMFSLPSPSSLRKLVVNCRVQTGFKTPIFKLLESKCVNMKELDKYCVIQLD